MKRSIVTLIAVTAAAWSFGAAAQPDTCANEIKKVEAAAVKVEKTDPPRADEARKLATEAKKLLAENKPAECVAIIERAKAVLNIK
jgi:hypothetical protein